MDSAVRTKTGLKFWIRAVALIIVAIFIPEQAAWAVEYNPAILWHNPSYAPLYGSLNTLANTPLEAKAFNMTVASSLLHSLKPLTSHKASLIRLKRGLQVERKVDLTSQKLKALYEWLRQPQTETVPCSTYTLYNFLQASGKNLNPASIASLLLFIDILLGNVQTGQNTIYNSLYAMGKTAAYFGLTLYPRKIKTKSVPYVTLTRFTPFIAHLKSLTGSKKKGHFILVTKVDKNKVYYFYDKGSDFLPLEKFRQEFSGYSLISYNYISDNVRSAPWKELEEVLGAKSDKYGYPDLSKYFKGPSGFDIGLSLALTIGGALFSAAGGFKGLSSGTFSFSHAFKNMSICKSLVMHMAFSEISQASATIAAKNFHFSPAAAQIFGYATAGALSGWATASQNSLPLYQTASNVTKGTFLEGFLGQHRLWAGTLFGGLQGAMVGGGTVLSYNAFKNTGLYKHNFTLANQIASFIGGTAGYLGFNTALDIAGINALQTVSPNKDKSFNKQLAKVGRPHYGYDYASGKLNLIGYDVYGAQVGRSNIGLLFHNPAFISHLVNRSVSLGVQYVLGGESFRYPAQIGNVAGSLAGGLVRGNFSLSHDIFPALMRAGLSVALDRMGGSFKNQNANAKNKWGLTRVEMAALEWGVSSLVFAGITSFKTPNGLAAGLHESFNNFIIPQLSVNYTSPYYTKGAAGLSQYQYMQNIADFTQISSLDATARFYMQQNHMSWRKLIDEGHISDILPGIDRAFVDYTASNLHYAAVENLAVLAAVPMNYVGRGISNMLFEHTSWKDKYTGRIALITDNPDITENASKIYQDSQGKLVIQYGDSKLLTLSQDEAPLMPLAKAKSSGKPFVEITSLLLENSFLQEGEYSRGVLGYIGDKLGLWSHSYEPGEKVGVRIRQDIPYAPDKDVIAGYAHHNTTFLYSSRDNDVSAKITAWVVRDYAGVLGGPKGGVISFIPKGNYLSTSGIYINNNRIAEISGTRIDKGMPQVSFNLNKKALAFIYRPSAGGAMRISYQGPNRGNISAIGPNMWQMNKGGNFSFDLDIVPTGQFTSRGVAYYTIPSSVIGGIVSAYNGNPINVDITSSIISSSLSGIHTTTTITPQDSFSRISLAKTMGVKKGKLKNWKFDVVSSYNSNLNNNIGGWEGREIENKIFSSHQKIFSLKSTTAFMGKNYIEGYKLNPDESFDTASIKQYMNNKGASPLITSALDYMAPDNLNTASTLVKFVTLGDKNSQPLYFIGEKTSDGFGGTLYINGTSGNLSAGNGFNVQAMRYLSFQKDNIIRQLSYYKEGQKTFFVRPGQYTIGENGNLQGYLLTPGGNQAELLANSYVSITQNGKKIPSSLNIGSNFSSSFNGIAVYSENKGNNIIVNAAASASGFSSPANPIITLTYKGKSPYLQR